MCFFQNMLLDFINDLTCNFIFSLFFYDFRIRQKGQKAWKSVCFVHFQKNTRRVVFIRKRKTIENPQLFKHLSSSLIFACVQLKNVEKNVMFYLQMLRWSLQVAIRV